MTVRYQSGTAYGLARDGAVVLLPEGASAALVDELWGLAGSGAGVIDVIQSLTGAAGANLHSIPPFAVAVATGRRVQLAVRGEVTATVRLAGETAHVDGVGVMTWTERTFDDVESFALRLGSQDDDGETATAAEPDLPLGAGVVRARSLQTFLVEGTAAQDGAGVGGATGTQVVGSSAEETVVPGWSQEPAPAVDRVPLVTGVPADPGAAVPDPGGVDGGAGRSAVEDPWPVPSFVPAGTAAPDGAAAPAGTAADGPPATLGADDPARTLVGTDDLVGAGEGDVLAAVPADGAPDGGLDAAPADLSARAALVDDPLAGPDALPVDGPVDDGGYGHLWGSTVLRTVEDAAMRVSDDEDEEDEGAPAPADAPEGRADDADDERGGTGPVPGPPPLPGPAPAAPPEEGMIAGVPREWTGATPAAAVRAATVSPAPAEDSAAPVLPALALDAPGSPGDDDHDGHTVLSAALADLRSTAAEEPSGTGPSSALPPAPPAPPGPPSEATESTGPSFSGPSGTRPRILGRSCAQGHPNPPSRDVCARCGGGLDTDAELVDRPSLGRAVLSNGQVIDLDRPVVVGRRPRSPRAQSSDLHRLVTVASPQQDISRSHVEIQLEGWHVLVSDLRTTNGTTLLRPGRPPQRLHPGEAVMVATDDVVDLGDDVTLTFEGLL